MATKSFIKTIGSKGLLADYNTEGKKLQTELTAGDNITISADNVISADKQIFFATYGVTTYNEVRDAILNGADVVVKKDSIILHSIWFGKEIYFESVVANPTMIRQVILKSDNSWSTVETPLQGKLTFDTTPTAGSKNPVTSDGIYKSMYSLSNPATPSSFTKDGESYYFVCRTKVGAWTRAAFEGYAFPVDWPTFDIIRIRSIVYADPPTDSAIVSITCGKQVYEKFNFVQAIYNGYCYIFANNPFRPLYINPNKYINSDTNSSSMTQDIFQTITLTKITPSIDDVILENTPKDNSTNPITSGGVKTAIDKLQSKLTFDNTPTSGSNNPVTSDGIKTALDSRIPSPTSSTGTQVLKCIDGVIQWVTE